MTILFYIAAICAIVATLKTITGRNPVHALLYLIASLLSVSVIFFILGAPFIAAMEVIIYAGAIMVLLIFVIMMLNVGGEGTEKEHALLKPRAWIGPSLIAVLLLSEMVCLLWRQGSQGMHPMAMREGSPAAVGQLLFTKYILVVEMAGFLLVAGIIGAYHLGEKETRIHHRYLKMEGPVK